VLNHFSTKDYKYNAGHKRLQLEWRMSKPQRYTFPLKLQVGYRMRNALWEYGGVQDA
jgi:hypothetical protein